MKHVAEALEQANVGKVWVEEPLAKHTTWRIGGPADLMIQPTDKEALIRAVQIIHQHEIPWTVIGRGSNLLVRDGGIRGAVFKVAQGLSHCEFQGETVCVGAGYSMVRLAVEAGKQGLTGLEFAGGIPGSVGGAVYMNAGAHGSDLSRILTSAEILFNDGETKIVSKEEMQFSYRTSLLQQRKGIVIEATLQLQTGDRREIAKSLAKFKDRRLSTQPFNSPCAGSVFRNPPGDHAGRLIEASGLKGFTIGGAQISEMHANFIVNRGGATATDVLTLIEYARATVLKNFNVDLHTEVLVIGEG
ncbi:UDP-N-acetylmuramate dehydrogenase [Brevibacillus laterosporus]|uniref:UDP-N-acetylenolpyruvoylglucosamine reductase n=2 Tax=Brevibacillus TaxID=55080 RepID=A0A0F7EGV8_BRELA|nr:MULTISPECIES: UDP-N-acetylmuramate dehydrogenase [Brevibacillus]AKF94393.1 UDP-N-acetylenolpyruvoylglucosamine reductase [Brevibacillus laterosporus]MCR8983877.1 UDP-N-acetylmuramate dehydrogenase [Brevibacillus laterosporus]MCZ0829596.1 UDP-N-acetylmuramate dehydrogenase [Brevibacillus halotolerans]OAJ73765.1 UDP-N-acetylenolpyruvoylglucosamine reductase [Brevibacillus sp. SKDU10]GIO00926.1 UDP-N-acetylenolpyruvoylglucosamine reductase [Brevibacillus halotolerans]